MNVIYTDPYSKECEVALTPFIHSTHGSILNTYRFSTFDWSATMDSPTQCELKTRYEYNSTAFSDVVINKSKLNSARLVYPHIHTYFYFWFKDGALYRWKYDPTTTLCYKPISRKDRDIDSRVEPHIPMSSLEHVGSFALPSRKCLI